MLLPVLLDLIVSRASSGSRCCHRHSVRLDHKGRFLTTGYLYLNLYPNSNVQFLDKLRRMVPDPPAFIVAIMPKPNDDGYRELKCHCLTNLGVPLQAVEYSKAMVPRVSGICVCVLAS